MSKRRVTPVPGRPLLPTVIAAMFAGALLLLGGTALGRQSIVFTPHNLAASGGYGQHNVAFAEEVRICVFCHVPHNARIPELLWSRDLPPDTSYTPYYSTTLKATPMPYLPTGSSRLCLSCHDGTIALGNYVDSRTGGYPMPSDVDPTRNPNLTTDLSDDHPISFVYSAALASQAELVAPDALPPAVKLDRDDELQCTSCHDPHDNQFGNFLVIDNSLSGSPLCTACHDKYGWSGSTHNPLHTPSLSAACMNCHYAHSAPEPERLLRSPSEEENCFLSCHNGSDPDSADVRSLVTSALYRHPVDATAGVHDPAEHLPASTYHVECVDCHNPHQSDGDQIPLAAAPAINGPLKGVRKDVAGTIATTEFDICFKCHAGASASRFASVTSPAPPRLVAEADQRNRFEVANPSFHPVSADRRGSGASLDLALQSSMIRIYCSDCHNSDQSGKAGGGGANGPHGSSFEHILIARYDMPLSPADALPYASVLYDLCFRCHEESYVMDAGTGFADGGSNLHDLHVRGERTPCFACHDPHGVSLTGGATASNNAHLINFNRSYTVSAAVPLPRYTTLAPRSGNCTVSCHAGSPTFNYGYAP